MNYEKLSRLLRLWPATIESIDDIEAFAVRFKPGGAGPKRIGGFRGGLVD